MHENFLEQLAGLDSMSGGRAEEAEFSDCLSYFELAARGFQAARLVDQLTLGADCHALRALQGATPARRTHLTGFSFDEPGVVGKLPPQLALAISRDDVRRIDAAGTRGVSWAELEGIAQDQVTLNVDGSLLVEGDGWAVRLESLAFADFDGDGTEDVLLKAGGRMTEGTYSVTRLLSLTRETDDGPLRLVREYNLSERPDPEP